MQAATGSMIECDPRLFRQNFNLLPHTIGHTLVNQPLLQLPALVDLAQRMVTRRNPSLPGGDVTVDEDETESGCKPWEASSDHGLPEAQRAATVQLRRTVQLVRRIESARASITLKHIEREDGYRELMEAALGDALRLAGEAGRQLLRKVKGFEAKLFLTSPKRVTEYHLDRECSWLLQIRGEKTIHLFNRADKEVVPEEELERFYTVDPHATRYKPHLQQRALIFDMTPGTGVHIPVNTPHWLRNGNNVSITLNVNLQFHDAEIANLYRANHYLRQAGMRPGPPGKNEAADRVKAFACTAALGLKRMLRTDDEVLPPEAKEQKRRIARLVAAR